MADSLQDTLKTALAVVRAVLWPFGKLAQAIAALLRPFWTVAQFVLLPVTYLVHGILSVLLLPLRLQLFERVETIYIYLGIAGLVGCLTGAILFIVFNILASSLSIDVAAEQNARARGRSAAEYRAAKRKKKGLPHSIPSSPDGTRRIDGTSIKQRGLLSQTIIEEEDSDF